MTRTGDTYDLAITQEHWAIEGRNLIRSATLEEFKENPAFVKEMEHGKEEQAHLALRRSRIQGPRSGAWRST